MFTVFGYIRLNNEQCVVFFFFDKFDCLTTQHLKVRQNYLCLCHDDKWIRGGVAALIPYSAALDEGEWSDSYPDFFIPMEGALCTH